ncbi:MAG: hypothetical protein ACOYM3_20585 [Terrimicrobiaceae bacterium]
MGGDNYQADEERKNLEVASKAARSTTCSPSGTEAAVCEDIARRQQIGIKKYGQTVSENPLTLKQWLQHAYEETLDQSVYLKRAIEELAKEEK